MAEWVNVQVEKGLNYSYVKVAGGWLVTLPATGSLTFIADPQHQTPPVALK